MSALIDTHAHLGDDQFSADRAEALARAEAAGVGRVVEIADAPADWDAAVALSRARPEQVRCALGLHPYYAAQYEPGLLARLEKKLKLPEVVAVGEIGLDYVKAEVGREPQLAAFRALLSFCRDSGAPAVVHCRGAYEDLRAVLGELFSAPPPQGRPFWGVVHCFSGGEDDALFCRDRGFALGVDGPVTYPKNDALRAALKAAGPECLVLETDSPYLPPQSRRGKRNEPALLPEIAERLAATMGLTPAELAQKTSSNARALFRL